MSTKPPSGTRDFLPEDIRRREHVMRVVRDVYESYGFEPLETPAFENIETLLGTYGEEGNQLIFKILRRGEHEASGQADLALRYDLTVPLARVVAQYQNDLPRFFKRYQIQPVWRADRPAKGRYREFYQCDIDALGSTSPMVEAELIGAVSEVLGRLGFDNYVIRLNHRKALTALLESAGVPVPLHGEALTAVDKLDKVGVEGVEKEFVARGIDAEAGRKCLSYFSESSGDTTPEAGLERFRAFIGGHESGIAAADNLAAIVRLASGGPGRGRVRLDASLARGLSYYTDAIMEIAVPDLTGSMAGGGRYDNLVGMFLGRDIPACGFSLGLERIIGVMAERGMFPAKVSKGPVDVMVTALGDDLRADALRLATELRAERLRVEVFPEASRKLDRSLKYASGRNVPVLVILGQDEQERGEVTVRDLQTRQQEGVSRATAAGQIARRVRIEAT
ncbi:MAG: histidine--tRNA ligase [Vicinamibacterales bacterium]